MAKQMMFSQEARRQILEGLTKLADAVRVTMGPTGRNVILQKSFGSPRVTKDGVTVSKEVELPQPFENIICFDIANSLGVIRKQPSALGGPVPGTLTPANEC